MFFCLNNVLALNIFEVETFAKKHGKKKKNNIEMYIYQCLIIHKDDHNYESLEQISKRF